MVLFYVNKIHEGIYCKKRPIAYAIGPLIIPYNIIQ